MKSGVCSPIKSSMQKIHVVVQRQKLVVRGSTGTARAQPWYKDLVRSCFVYQSFSLCSVLGRTSRRHKSCGMLLTLLYSICQFQTPPWTLDNSKFALTWKKSVSPGFVPCLGFFPPSHFLTKFTLNNSNLVCNQCILQDTEYYFESSWAACIQEVHVHIRVSNGQECITCRNTWSSVKQPGKQRSRYTLGADIHVIQ